MEAAHLPNRLPAFWSLAVCPTGWAAWVFVRPDTSVGALLRVMRSQDTDTEDLVLTPYQQC